jgi:hypothetical protein
MAEQKIVGLFSVDAKGELCFHPGAATAERAARLCESLDENVTGGPYTALLAIAAPVSGVALPENGQEKS